MQGCAVFGGLTAHAGGKRACEIGLRERTTVVSVAESTNRSGGEGAAEAGGTRDHSRSNIFCVHARLLSSVGAWITVAGCARPTQVRPRVLPKTFRNCDYWHMGKLIYMFNVSLDGYICDADGNFDWSEPNEEVHSFIGDLQRPIDTYLYGRRLYETMAVWETLDDPAPVMQDYAQIWRAATKVVVSSSLTEISSERTRIVRELDPLFIEELKRGDSDILIGGANLAAHAIRAGLVDEYGMFIHPAIVGNGTRFLPDDVDIQLTLLGQRVFDGGVVYLRYAVTPPVE
jgi:dihydrofolate reductase